MADVYKVMHSDMVSVADAIRAKGETTEQLVFPGGFVAAIAGMETGKTGATLTVTTPAEGVTVTVAKGELSYTKTTGADYTATFTGLESGTWTITISDGSQTATGTVDIDADYAANMTFFSATINVTYPAGLVCTATDGVTTLTAPDTSGTWACIVPNAGTWSIAVSSIDYTWTVDITENQQTESVDATQTYLYKNGDECSSITGGWALSTGGSKTHGESLTKNSGSMVFSSTYVRGSHFAYGYLRTNKKIDLSEYSSIYVELSGVSSGADKDSNLALTISESDTREAYDISLAKANLTTGCTSSTLDVSAISKECYIGISAQSGASDITSTATIIYVVLRK